jgi:hypothetical protein
VWDPPGTNGVVNFIWKGRCSENISLRTKRCVYFTPNGAHYVPDLKPVLQKPGNFTRLSSVGLKMADGQGEKKIPLPHPPAFKMYLMFFRCTSNVCSSPYLYHNVFHYTRYRYGTKSYYRYQSIRPLLTMSLRGLLLGVGDGGREG